MVKAGFDLCVSRLAFLCKDNYVAYEIVDTGKLFFAFTVCARMLGAMRIGLREDLIKECALRAFELTFSAKEILEVLM